MTLESRELASAKAYIESRGLTEPFLEFHRKREQALIDGSKPEFYISRLERVGDRRRSDTSANITPWLRTADVDQVQRLIDIDPDNLADEGEEDTADDHFLDVIWAQQPDQDYENLDEDDDDWTRCYSYGFEINLKKLKDVIKVVNPVVYRHLFISPEELGQSVLSL